MCLNIHCILASQMKQIWLHCLAHNQRPVCLLPSSPGQHPLSSYLLFFVIFPWMKSQEKANRTLVHFLFFVCSRIDENSSGYEIDRETERISSKKTGALACHKKEHLLPLFTPKTKHHLQSRKDLLTWRSGRAAACLRAVKTQAPFTVYRRPLREFVWLI